VYFILDVDAVQRYTFIFERQRQTVVSIFRHQMQKRAGQFFHIDGGFQRGRYTGHVTIFDHGASIDVVQKAECWQSFPGARASQNRFGIFEDGQIDDGRGRWSVIIFDRSQDIDGDFQIQSTVKIDGLTILGDDYVGGVDFILEGLTIADTFPVDARLFRQARRIREGQSQRSGENDDGGQHFQKRSRFIALGYKSKQKFDHFLVHDHIWISGQFSVPFPPSTAVLISMLQTSPLYTISVRCNVPSAVQC